MQKALKTVKTMHKRISIGLEISLIVYSGVITLFPIKITHTNYSVFITNGSLKSIVLQGLGTVSYRRKYSLYGKMEIFHYFDKTAAIRSRTFLRSSGLTM